MTNEECFAVWAPDGVVWSQWSKPVVFTQIDRTHVVDRATLDWTSPRLDGVPTAGRTAVVVDVSGASAIRLGPALAKIGYRPVPRFNCTSGSSELIDVDLAIARYG